MTEFQIKEAVRERDGRRCTECGIGEDEHYALHKQALHVHRINPGSPYSVEGGVTLCRKCHGPKPKSPPWRNINRVKKPKSIVIAFQLSCELAEALRLFATNRKPSVTKAAVIRAALAQFLKERGFLST